MWQRAGIYASQHRISLGGKLGSGVHGLVLAAQRHVDTARIALKIHRHKEPYRRERGIYERLALESVSEVCGFHVPQLVACDEDLWVLEMTVVTRPFVLDFAGAYLDRPPEFPDNVWSEWEAEKREQFGSRWNMVEDVLAAIKAHGVFLTDVSPTNIAFLEEAAP